MRTPRPNGLRRLRAICALGGYSSATSAPAPTTHAVTGAPSPSVAGAPSRIAPQAAICSACLGCKPRFRAGFTSLPSCALGGCPSTTSAAAPSPAVVAAPSPSAAADRRTSIRFTCLMCKTLSELTQPHNAAAASTAVAAEPRNDCRAGFRLRPRLVGRLRTQLLQAALPPAQRGENRTSRGSRSCMQHSARAAWPALTSAPAASSIWIILTLPLLAA